MSLFSVIPTFFNNDMTVNKNKIEQHINEQINRGIKNIVILGTTSETPTLSLQEKFEIAVLVYENFKNRVNIVCGISGSNTIVVLDQINMFKDFCHCLMISPPCYNKPTQEGIYQHFCELLKNLEKDVILYNVPGRTCVNMSVDLVCRLTKEFNIIVGIKEASGDLNQINELIIKSGIKVYSGDDKIALPVLSIGGAGLISVASNIYPEKMLDLVNNMNKDIHNELYDIFNLLFIESNPVPLKFILGDPIVRLPLVELSGDSKRKINNSLN